MGQKISSLAKNFNKPPDFARNANLKAFLKIITIYDEDMGSFKHRTPTHFLGMGGIGKSSLLSKLLEEVKSSPSLVICSDGISLPVMGSALIPSTQGVISFETEETKSKVGGWIQKQKITSTYFLCPFPVSWFSEVQQLKGLINAVFLLGSSSLKRKVLRLISCFLFKSPIIQNQKFRSFGPLFKPPKVPAKEADELPSSGLCDFESGRVVAKGLSYLIEILLSRLKGFFKLFEGQGGSQWKVRKGPIEFPWRNSLGISSGFPLISHSIQPSFLTL